MDAPSTVSAGDGGVPRTASSAPVRPSSRTLSAGRTASAVGTRHHARPSTAQPLTFQGPVGVVRSATPSELEGIVHRLYRQSIDDAQRRRAAAQSKASEDQVRATSPHAALTGDEVKESVDRLYTSGIKHKLDTHKRLAEKYLFQHKSRIVSATPQELRERVVQRFYTEEPARQQKRVDELHQAYVSSTGPKVALRSRDRIQDIVDRLYKGSN